ncbi:MAG: ATP-binding protein [Candidatus Omnitrophica bacterium]|nr:ATP-binding protein [Candidatus Omnitrophota bacterium]
MELFSLLIKKDKDILAARDRARVICEELGFSVTQQLQVTTAVFELGKNILEHGGGGEIDFSLQSDGDTLSLEVLGKDVGPGISEEEIEDLLKTGSSKSTANRGIPAMKRLMDSIEIESEPGAGTTIRLIKQKTKSAKTLAKNIVSFLQDKFTARNKLTLSEELRKQNINLVQTLSLYEEKNDELQKKNKELLDLKQQLEDSNAELHNRTAELQEALLSLGDRTSELEAQNRRFTAVMEQIPGGVVITDRSGVVTKANRRFYSQFGMEGETVEEIQKMDWYSFLARFKNVSEDEWNKLTISWDNQPTQVHTTSLQTQNNQSQTIQCRTVPILDAEQKVLGRIWIFENPVSEN